MHRIAVLGGGELGATLVRRLAEMQLAREVVLVEADESRAKGKALDLAQSGPVEAYDTRLVGAGSLEAAGPSQVVVLADPPELESADGRRALVDSLVKVSAGAVLLVAGNDAGPIVETAVNRGAKRDRTLGTHPVADAAALRRALAEELGVDPSEVQLSLIGSPERWIVPNGSATVSGLPVDGSWPMAVRKALQVAQRKPRGPVALAHGAARVVRALQASRDTILPLVVALEGELGRRGVALTVPARVGGGRLRGVVEPALEVVDRIALDNAAERRRGPA
jgi:malate dehydrogenase